MRERSRSTASSVQRVCCLCLCVALGQGLVPVRAADCNRNGVEDSLDIANAASGDCNENGIPDDCEVVPLAFQVDESVEVPRTARVLRYADIDRDGRLDLITGRAAGPDHG